MKALVYTGPEQLSFCDHPDATARAGEELVRVARSGICGSDMHAFLGHDERRPAPLILGHEAAGVIVGGDNAGQRVTINPLVSCLACVPCRAGRENLCAQRQIISMPPRAGALADLVAVPRMNVVQVPGHVSLRKAALAEPIACGWHAVRVARKILDGDLSHALVIGGGAIGVGATLSLIAQGVAEVTILETSALRRDYLGAVVGLHAIGPDDLGGEVFYDLVIDAVGFGATREIAGRHTTPGGVIAHIGLGEAKGGLDVRRMTLQEITFVGTYTYSQADFQQTAQAIFDGRLGSLDWVEERPLSEGARAFADLREGKTAAPKVMLVPDDSIE